MEALDFWDRMKTIHRDGNSFIEDHREVLVMDCN